MKRVNNWLRGLIVNRHFRIDWRAHTVILAVAVSISFLIYIMSIASFQRDIVSQYEDAPVICDILRQSTLSHPGRCAPKRKGMDEKEIGRGALIELLSIAEVIDEDEASDLRQARALNPENSAAEFIITKLEMDTSYRQEDIHTLSGLSWVVHLAQSIGNQSGAGDAVPGSVMKLHRGWLAASLANVKLSGYTRAVDAYQEEIEDGDRPFSEDMISGIVLFTPELVDDTDVISSLYQALGVLTQLQAGNNTQREDTQLKLLKERFDSVDKLVKFIVAQSHADLGVKSSKRRLTILRGPEQLIILVLTMYLLIVLLMRVYLQRLDKAQLGKLSRAVADYAHETLKERNGQADPSRLDELTRTLRERLQSLTKTLGSPKKSLLCYMSAVINNKLMPHEREVEIATMRGVGQSEIDQLFLSRWTIRWSTRIIPAIGFIGTVRGILNALPATDDIVWAASRAERASAIGVVATDLGLAFATTFMALVVGVILSWLNDLQMTSEEKYVVRLSELGSTAVDPRLGTG